jgi:hypothetical protein
MTLAQQFPDISASIRSRNKTEFSSIRSANAIPPVTYTEAEGVVRYYQGEFNRWHLKLFLIVAGTLGIVYYIILKAFWIYNTVVNH